MTLFYVIHIVHLYLFEDNRIHKSFDYELQECVCTILLSYVQELKIKVSEKDVCPPNQHSDSQLGQISLPDSDVSEHWGAGDNQISKMSVREQNKIRVRKKDDSLPKKCQQLLRNVQQCLGMYLTRRLCTDISKNKPVIPMQEKRKTEPYRRNEFSLLVDLPENKYCVHLSGKHIPDLARNDSLSTYEVKATTPLQEQSKIKVKYKENYDEHLNNFCHHTDKDRVYSQFCCSSTSSSEPHAIKYNMEQGNVDSSWITGPNGICMVNESDHLTERREQERVPSNSFFPIVIQLGLVILYYWWQCLLCFSHYEKSSISCNRYLRKY